LPTIHQGTPKAGVLGVIEIFNAYWVTTALCCCRLAGESASKIPPDDAEKDNIRKIPMNAALPRFHAMYVRVDSIGQAIRDSGTMAQPINEAGYRVAYAIAADNLRLGRTVISDSVNPIHLSRDAWISVANRARVRVAEVEIICSDPLQHRQRVETRPSDINGLRLPTWEEVIAREYEPWDRQLDNPVREGWPTIRHNRADLLWRRRIDNHCLRSCGSDDRNGRTQ
jgi:predicted kinase